MTASLRTRLTLWYTAGLGATLLAFGLVLERALTRDLRTEFDEHLASAAGVVRFSVRDMLRDVGPEATSSELLRELRFIDLTVAIAMDQRSIPRSWLAGSDSVLILAADVGPCREAPVTRRQLRSTAYRVLIQCVSVSGLAQPVTVVVGAPEKELVDQVARIRWIVALTLIVGLTLTTLGGHWLSGRAIGPIRRMAAQVGEIDAANLSQRLPVSARDGEIALLSSRVNELFDRLAATITHEHRFLANAAHALRTPVTILRNEAQETAERADLSPEARVAVAEMETLASHLGRTVEYLLSLARRDAGGEAIAPQAVYLDDVVSGTVARLTPLAQRRRIHIEWKELSETPVQANAAALDQVTQVLLENALQFAPEDSTVTVSVAPADGGGHLVVHDAGPGLTPEDLQSVFAPFVRGSAARRTGTPGSGLGLAVAKWLIETCGGSIRVGAASPKGTRFEVRLPGGNQEDRTGRDAPAPITRPRIGDLGPLG